MSKKPNTPKSGGKDKKVEIQSKINYGIFVINFDKSLWAIAKQFQEELQEYDRRAVLGFRREDVVREILIQQEKARKEKESKALAGKGKKDKKEEKVEKEPKDKKGKKDKGDPKSPDVTKEETKKEVQMPEVKEETKPIDLKMFVLDEKTFGLFSSKVKENIDKAVKKSEAIARSIKSHEEFDLLKYWQEKGVSVPKPGDAKKGKEKGTADKKDKKGAKESRARGGAEKVKGKKQDDKDGPKGKKKEDKVKNQPDDTGCVLKEVKVVKLDEKPWSKIQPRVYNEPVKFKVW